MIPAENIVQERYIVCASWKWLGETRITSVSTLGDPARYAKRPHDDRYVVTRLHEVLSRADALIHHNGTAYDTKFTETRILVHGLPALPPIPQIDTLKTAKLRLLFNSNRLDYLGRFLGVGHKKVTKAGLWLRVLQGDKRAIREMVAYNRQDVLLLERVFLKLRPYIPDCLNRQLLGQAGCPRCGSTRVQSRGTHRAITRLYRRFQCQECGGWHREVKAITAATPTRLL